MNWLGTFGIVVLSYMGADGSAAQNPSNREVRSQVAAVSFDFMAASARNPCDTNSIEARRFRSKNSVRWERIRAALQEQYGDDMAQDLGVVIPEACLDQRATTLSERRKIYEADIQALEKTLGIAGKRP
ncbi:hypothetical protein GON01_08470 [Sphingomonas sp. MAH-20]|uniref:Uncharacterized protein n=1 Tax=Sphingomonas horti TaxID=2682842 RepID=A0A6I4J0K1_9SPHN|nr:MULTISPECIES: hypothetical protein [Sphingomonas]MBA2919724.1 hypothetical protein [Sphingomonas sp. CGMCC 1.13658]MVO77965.1 hypothetical protein [Sphingomonas horti]